MNSSGFKMCDRRDDDVRPHGHLFVQECECPVPLLSQQGAMRILDALVKAEIFPPRLYKDARVSIDDARLPRFESKEEKAANNLVVMEIKLAAQYVQEVIEGKEGERGIPVLVLVLGKDADGSATAETPFAPRGSPILN